MSWNPQRELFAYSDTSGKVLIHDLQQRDWRWQIPTGQTCHGLVWHPTDMSLLLALADGTLCWWNLDKEQPEPQSSLHSPLVQSVALHPQRQYIISGDSAGQLACWRGNNSAPTWKPESIGSGIYALQCFPSQLKVLVGNRDGRLHIFDLAKKAKESSWDAHKKSVRALLIPAHEKWFASCGNDQRIHLWRSGGGEPLCTLSGRQGALRALAYNPAGDWMASGGETSSICIWDTSLWS